MDRAESLNTWKTGMPLPTEMQSRREIEYVFKQIYKSQPERFNQPHHFIPITFNGGNVRFPAIADKPLREQFQRAMTNIRKLFLLPDKFSGTIKIEMQNITAVRVHNR